MWWLKVNKPHKYKQLEDKLKTIRLPLNVVLDIMDAILYYKSELKAIKVILRYNQNREEITMNQRVNDLAQWSRTFSM